MAARPTTTRTTTELAIDWTRCDGHGLCAALLPQAITRDEWGFPIIDRKKVAKADELSLKRAVATCPALALRLERTSSSAPTASPARPRRTAS
jgi:ferredoxin